ncbi:MAG: hypothetical protein ACI9C1_000975 [Candidatus Aldehydirespiratoraceae bacterium]|jgi:hypothetical protein
MPRSSEVPRTGGGAPGVEALFFDAIVFPASGCPVAGVGSPLASPWQQVVNLALRGRDPTSGPITSDLREQSGIASASGEEPRAAPEVDDHSGSIDDHAPHMVDERASHDLCRIDVDTIDRSREAIAVGGIDRTGLGTNKNGRLVLIGRLVDYKVGGGVDQLTIGADGRATTDELHECVVSELSCGARKVLAPFVAEFGLRRFDIGEAFGVDEPLEDLRELGAVDRHEATTKIPESVEVLHRLDLAAAPAFVGLVGRSVLVNSTGPLDAEPIELDELHLASGEEKRGLAYRHEIAHARIAPYGGDPTNLVGANKTVGIGRGDSR